MAGLKFCLLTTFYPPFNFGGDGIDVQRTARALVKRGHSATVIHGVNAYEWLAGRRPDPPPADDGVEVISLRSRLGMVAPLLTHQFGYPVVDGRRIRDIIKRRSFDVIVFNEVLEYFTDPVQLVQRYEKWLVPGGEFVVSQYRADDDARTRKIWRNLHRQYTTRLRTRVTTANLTWTIEAFAPPV